MSTLRHTTSSCWRLRTSCPRYSPHWCCLTLFQNQYARCKHQPSSRWPNPRNSHSLLTQQIMRGLTHCLHPPPHIPLQVNCTPISKVTGVHPRFLLGHQAHHKSCSFRETTRCHSHLRYLEQPRTQRFPHHNHNPSLRLSPLGLMKSLQPSSQNVQRLKRSFKTVHTLEEFVNTPLPVMLTTSAQRPHVPLPRYRPTILPLRPQPSFPQPPP